jgi:hypothetical protein
MRFTLDLELPGDVDDVLAALLDPELLRSLDGLPNLGAPKLLSQDRDGHTVVQRVHYQFTGTLSAAVTRVIDPRNVTWVDETTYDLAARRATSRILPDHYADKLRCTATHTFTQRGDVTVRRVEGDLSVRVPLVGRVVERAIVSGLEDHLRAEADLLARWLQDKA